MVECELFKEKINDYSEAYVLIDTWWNVNDYLLDCFAFYYQVLIDTWWNVNTERPDINIFHAVVLIDTWWNVNVSSIKKALGTGAVLIDTWWNVNWGLSWIQRMVFSFNRYMVECEFDLILPCKYISNKF